MTRRLVVALALCPLLALAGCTAAGEKARLVTYHYEVQKIPARIVFVANNVRVDPVKDDGDHYSFDLRELYRPNRPMELAPKITAFVVLGCSGRPVSLQQSGKAMPADRFGGAPNAADIINVVGLTFDPKGLTPPMQVVVDNRGGKADELVIGGTHFPLAADKAEKFPSYVPLCGSAARVLLSGFPIGGIPAEGEGRVPPWVQRLADQSRFAKGEKWPGVFIDVTHKRCYRFRQLQDGKPIGTETMLERESVHRLPAPLDFLLEPAPKDTGGKTVAELTEGKCH